MPWQAPRTRRVPRQADYALALSISELLGHNSGEPKSVEQLLLQLEGPTSHTATKVTEQITQISCATTAPARRQTSAGSRTGSRRSRPPSPQATPRSWRLWAKATPRILLLAMPSLPARRGAIPHRLSPHHASTAGCAIPNPGGLSSVVTTMAFSPRLAARRQRPRGCRAIAKLPPP